MGAEGLDCLLAGNLTAVLGGGEHRNDVAVGYRGMDEDAGSLDVRHDGHQVHCLVAGRLLHLQSVSQATVIIAGVRHAADDGNGNLFNAELSVQAVDGADQTGGVAAGELQKLLAQTQVVIGIAVEKHVCDAVLLAALENGLNTQTLINGLVGCARSSGRGVQHDVHLFAQLLKAAFDRDAQRIKSGLEIHINEVELILHAVYANHVVFCKCPDCERGRMSDDTNELHVILERNTVCQTRAYGAVARYADLNFFHTDFLTFNKVFNTDPQLCWGLLRLSLASPGYFVNFYY